MSNFIHLHNNLIMFMLLVSFCKWDNRLSVMMCLYKLVQVRSVPQPKAFHSRLLSFSVHALSGPVSVCVGTLGGTNRSVNLGDSI